jgi:hypothetical protein
MKSKLITPEFEEDRIFIDAKVDRLIIHKPVFKDVVTIKQPDKFLDAGIVGSNEIGDLQGSLQELNKDEINKSDKTSGIDLRSRLHPIEISSIVILDNLVALKFLPVTVIPVTLQKKRLNVSEGGKGREEIVNIVRGNNETQIQKGGGMTRGLMSMFKKEEPK